MILRRYSGTAKRRYTGSLTTVRAVDPSVFFGRIFLLITSKGNRVNDLQTTYNLRTAGAWVLGHARNAGKPELPEALRGKKVDECSSDELLQIVGAAREEGLKLYPFKLKSTLMARTRRTFGFLHSVCFETLLDVGSGRGAFLIPFIEEFPNVDVTSIDLLDYRATFLNELADGGFGRLRAELKDVCEQPFPDGSFDVVTLLEVLEHIPNVAQAVAAAVRMAKSYVVVTVPSKPDDNPDHIHLLTKDKLTEMFNAAGCSRLHFDGVEGHLFMVAAINA